MTGRGTAQRERAVTGWAPLLRLALRRDRIMLPAWIYGIVLTVVSTASSYDRLYPTEADRAQVAASALHLQSRVAPVSKGTPGFPGSAGILACLPS